jgi:hypothetical protein
MMRGGHRDDPTRSAHAAESIPLRKVVHEVVDSSAGWRLMPADSDVMFRARSPFTRRHRELATNTRDPKHRRGRFPIELPVQPLNELGRRRFSKRSGSRHSIDFRLDAHMCSRLEL